MTISADGVKVPARKIPAAAVLDHYIEKHIGLVDPLPVTQMAIKHGLIGEYDVQASGVIAIKDFEIPKTVAADWAVPSFVKKILKRVFVKKPRLKKEECKSCAICCKVCPAGALEFLEEHPVFDYKKCIQCYCCQEMCPEGAITV